MEAKVIFKNGQEINAELNGSSLIVNEKPEFPEDMSGVIVRANGSDTVYNYPILVECASIDQRYWFTFIEEAETDRTIRELREENQMLEDAIIELAEIIGGGE